MISKFPFLNLVFAVKCGRDAQIIGVHGESEKSVITLPVMRFFSGLSDASMDCVDCCDSTAESRLNLRRAFLLGISFSLFTTAAIASDSPRELCQQQVLDFGIAPEQQQDYVRDCIASMGGEPEADTTSAPPATSDSSHQSPNALGDSAYGSSGER